MNAQSGTPTKRKDRFRFKETVYNQMLRMVPELSYNGTAFSWTLVI